MRGEGVGALAWAFAAAGQHASAAAALVVGGDADHVFLADGAAGGADGGRTRAALGCGRWGEGRVSWR